MSKAEYKGYIANIRFDKTDNIFVGEVINIKDSLNFHGGNEAEAVKMFHQSIDNYLDICSKMGKQPDTPNLR